MPTAPHKHHTTGAPWPPLAWCQEPSRPVCPPTLSSMPMIPLRMCKEPHVCAPMPYGLCLETLSSPVICLPWQRWHSESHTWGVNMCCCEPSLCRIGCQEESHQVGKTQHPPHLSLAAGLSQRPRWRGCPVSASSSWLPKVYGSSQQSGMQIPWEMYPGLLHPYSEDHLLLAGRVQSSTGISASCVCVLQEGGSAWFHLEILKDVRLT